MKRISPWSLMAGPWSLVLLLCAGCSGLQATGTSAAMIRSGSGSSLAAGATYFKAVHADATVSAINYILGLKTPAGARATIWSNASIYATIQAQDAVANELNRRIGTLSAANAETAGGIERQYAANLQWQLAGQPATSNLATVARLKTTARAPEPITAERIRRAASQPATTAIDINSLIASLPAQFRPWASQYGPSLLRAGVAEADAELALLLSGDTDTPNRAALAQMTEAELMAEAANVLTQTVAVTNANAATVVWEKQAATGFVSVAITIILGLLGL